MKVAQVTSWGTAPTCQTVPDLPPPSPTQMQLTVLTVGIPRVVQIRATGKHPSVFDSPLPFDPSIDGVGRDDTTGDVYFIHPLAAPLLAERANVERHHLVKLAPGADPVSVAALANPMSSSWMALRRRAIGGCTGRTVLILGATSASGRTAALVARSLGAARIVGLSRREETLETVDGLDERVILREPFVLPPSAGPIHIILDYVGGSAAAGILQNAEVEPGENLQYIQVGGLASEDTHMLQVLPPYLINTKPICIMGSGLGSVRLQDLKDEMPDMVRAMMQMPSPFELETVSLSNIQSVWDSANASKRLVVIPTAKD
ncbi:NAD(P)-binding protein [Aspergillus steynii IBT 23096]|uniref:NAD(P)-binding protein n=1 Tax=Aspergillus steynii IBT 23096 TaxID=1392250 RepID=A0A2I2G065_9EURO|nr:NAD(P)-binding protein [Aspergillus steynii IBT 23096]PLB46278.1 NAD(P)-binding protein [Aspergillus steynii IBT 23096]